MDGFIKIYEENVGPMNGAKVVAKAWVDPEYKARLLEEGTAAIAELGFKGPQGEHIVVAGADARTTHNVVVCTLCSCYPWPVLGLPPSWYKDPAYRSRMVREPRTLLAEMGLDAGRRRRRPGLGQLAPRSATWCCPSGRRAPTTCRRRSWPRLVTRDAMVGVAKVPARRDRRPSAVLDVDGPAAPPRSNGELVFAEPWESRAFGLALALHDGGAFEWEDFRQQLIATIADVGRSEDVELLPVLAGGPGVGAGRPGRRRRGRGRRTGPLALAAAARRPRPRRPRPRARPRPRGPRPRLTLSVDATWDGGYRCRVKARDFEIRADEPVKAGGDDTGPQPTELFLASLASCFTLALAHVARKREIELPDLVGAGGRAPTTGPSSSTSGSRSRSSHPREELEMLAERASAVCYVSNTIRALHDTEVVIT